jgi:hypothetical protein
MPEEGMIPPGGDAPARSVRLWLVAAFALCVFPIVARTTRPLDEQLFLPVTPLDRTDGERARQWAFLESCRSHIPSNAEFTIVAEDPRTAMSLYMMSIGAFPFSLPLPSSYYGTPTPEAGGTAAFVLAYGRLAPEASNLRLVARVRDGAIYARRPAP